MKILHIISGLTNGGAEAVLFRIVTSDSDNSHHVISMMDDGYYGERIRDRNIELSTLDMPSGRLTWRGCKKLFHLIKQIDPDVIQTWMYHADLIGGVIGRCAGKKNIFWGVHHTTHNPNDRWLNSIIPKICALCSYIVPKKIICCAESAVIVHRHIGYKNDKLVCVKNGYDLKLFSPSDNLRNLKRAEWQRSYGLGDNTIIFGMVGRYNPQKDHENLLKALEKLNAQTEISWHCIFAGADVDQSNKELTQSANSKMISDQVLLLGPIEDVPAFMNAVDIHILPSAFGEAYPNVIAEAMACGTPCIATNVGDSADMIGTTGWVVQPAQADQLLAAINDAVDEITHSPELWKRREQSARTHSLAEFSLENMKFGYQTHWAEIHSN